MLVVTRSGSINALTVVRVGGLALGGLGSLPPAIGSLIPRLAPFIPGLSAGVLPFPQPPQPMTTPPGLQS